MAEHYYLVSSLPFLRLKELPPIKYNDFLDNCLSWLNKNEMSQIRNSRIDIENILLGQVTNSVLKDWIVFENSLRNELVRIRANETGISADQYIRTDIESDPVIFSVVREAVKAPSPLKIEMNFIELRWKFLEQYEVGHYFDLTALVLYGLKLQLLERQSLFDISKGQKVFHTIYEGNKDEEERKYRENSSN
ncbi:MAG: DUF2764 family protein [Candidatus Aureabacteria bacterium]|nr:DUF2764 family protein [Candidatus Auribacterota bacterium]